MPDLQIDEESRDRSIDYKAQELANFVVQRGECSRADIAQSFHLAQTASSAALSRWIAKAIEMNLICRQGSTNAVRFTPSEKSQKAWLDESLAKPLSHRQKVSYNFDYLEDYIPNRTSYLGKDQLSSLMRRCPPGAAPLSDFEPADISTFLCELAYHSAKLEGVKYSLADTVSLIEKQIEMENGDPRDRIIILNHRDAVNYLIDNTKYPPPQRGQTGMTVDVREVDIRSLHSLLSEHLLEDPRKAGSLREEHIEITDSAYIPLRVPQQIAAAFKMICEKGRSINNPYEAALFLSIHIPYLQPFVDCNKRTSRLSANIPLLRKGCAPMAWTDINRDIYSRALLAVYECQAHSDLTEIFTESYLRGCERLSFMKREKTPDAIALQYRSEIRKAIKDEVENLVYTRPPQVEPQDHAVFDRYVAEQLEALLYNPIIGVRYGLHADAIARYRDSDSNVTNRSSQNQY